MGNPREEYYQALLSIDPTNVTCEVIINMSRLEIAYLSDNGWIGPSHGLPGDQTIRNAIRVSLVAGTGDVELADEVFREIIMERK